MLDNWRNRLKNWNREIIYVLINWRNRLKNCNGKVLNVKRKLMYLSWKRKYYLCGKY